jgi:hypothetical protein
MDSIDDTLVPLRATTAILRLKKKTKGSRLIGRHCGPIVKPDIVTARATINNFIQWEFALGIIIIIIIIRHELDLN